MAFTNDDPRVDDGFVIKNRAVGYDQLHVCGGMYFIPEGISVHVSDRFEAADKNGKRSKFVTIENIHRPSDKWTIKVGTLLNAVADVEEPDMDGRCGFFFPEELHCAPENMGEPSGAHIDVLAKLQQQMQEDVHARYAAAATPGTVTLSKLLPAPYEQVALPGTQIEVVAFRDGQVTIKAPGFPVPVIVDHQDLAASIAT